MAKIETSRTYPNVLKRSFTRLRDRIYNNIKTNPDYTKFVWDGTEFDVYMQSLRFMAPVYTKDEFKVIYTYLNENETVNLVRMSSRIPTRHHGYNNIQGDDINEKMESIISGVMSISPNAYALDMFVRNALDPEYVKSCIIAESVVYCMCCANSLKLAYAPGILDIAGFGVLHWAFEKRMQLEIFNEVRLATDPKRKILRVGADSNLLDDHLDVSTISNKTQELARDVYKAVMMLGPTCTCLVDVIEPWVELNQKLGKELNDNYAASLDANWDLLDADMHIDEFITKHQRKKILVAYTCLHTRFTSDYYSGAPAVYIYMLKLYKDGKLPNSKTSENKLKAFLVNAALARGREELYNLYKAVHVNAPKLYDKYRFACESSEKANEKLKAQIDRTNEVRKSMRESRKEVEALQKEVKKLTNEAARMANPSERYTKHDFEKLETKLHQRETEIKDLRESLGKVSRDLSSREKDYGQSQLMVYELQGKLEKTEDALENEKKLTSELSSHRAFNMLPVECFVNAIKGKRIILIGGDMMFPKLNDYGLDNITKIAAGSRHMNSDMLRGADIVVICTKFVDHSSCEMAIDYTRQHQDTQYLPFNGKNSDALIFALFEKIYSEV